MRFSIVVPFQKGIAYLTDCFESLKEQKQYSYSPYEQTEEPEFSEEPVRLSDNAKSDYIVEPFRDFEVLLVLDHCKEDVSEIVEKYKQYFTIRIFEQKDTTGVGAARNIGIANAEGEYVYFLDSDDYLLESALYYMDAAAADRGCPDIIYGKKLRTWYSRKGYLQSMSKKTIKKRDSKLLNFVKKRASRLAKEEGISETVAYEVVFDKLMAALSPEEIPAFLEKKEKLIAEAMLETADEAEADENEGLQNDSEPVEAESSDNEDNSDNDDDDEDDEETASDNDDKDTSTEIDEDTIPEGMTVEEYIEFRRNGAAGLLISKRKGIKNVSALAIAYKKSLLTEQSIIFPENNRYYADMPFVCEVLAKAQTFRKCYTSEYVKRKHGDPIHFPSLAQESGDEKFEEMIDSYRLARERIPEGSSIGIRADRKMINYCTGYYALKFRQSEEDIWRKERFDMMRKIMQQVPKESWEESKSYKKKVIKAIIAGDRGKLNKIVRWKRLFEKVRECMFSRSKTIRAFYVHSFLKKPIKKQTILFQCFFGKSYGDNPKAIYEYIAKTYPGEYNLVWAFEKPSKQKLPYAHKSVKYLGLRYCYYLATAKYFVFNTKQPAWMAKRDGQIFLETWHGTPLKKLAFDMEDNFSAFPGYKGHIFKMKKDWDYLISANSFSSEKFKSCFLFDGPMLEFGYPRNDILHRPDRDAYALEIKKKLGIPLDKKTILYAPTWRDDEYYAAGKYKFKLKLELPKLREALGDEYVILLRTHYYIADNLDVTGMEGFAYNLSKYPDIADIYLISDICITDYSSVFFDYANLKRPLLFYTYDIDKYRDMLRGFYFDMESTVPGPLLYKTEEIIYAIKHIDLVSECYAKRYDEFYERFCGWEDGRASEHVVETVIRGK